MLCQDHSVFVSNHFSQAVHQKQSMQSQASTRPSYYGGLAPLLE